MMGNLKFPKLVSAVIFIGFLASSVNCFDFRQTFNHFGDNLFNSWYNTFYSPTESTENAWTIYDDDTSFREDLGTTLPEDYEVPFETKSTFGPFEMKSSFSPFETKSTFGPFETKSTFAPFETKSTFGPFETKSTYAPFETKSTFGPFETKSTFAPFSEKDEPLNPPIDFISVPMSGHQVNDKDVESASEVLHPEEQPQSTFDSSSLFQNHFGNFFNPSPPPSNEFFGTGGFPQFGFFDFPSSKPWWKGTNVCSQREEEEEDIKEGNNQEITDGSSSSSFQGFGNFNINLESCVERQNKYVCTSVTNINGQKKTVKITRQCCHGFARPENTYNAQCEKIDTVPLPETAENLGAAEFVRSAKTNGLEDMLSGNVTVFAPSDSAFTTFAESMLEKNLVVLPPYRKRRAVDISGITTKDLIMAHTVQGIHHIEDIDNEQLLPTEFENASIRINIFPRGPEDQTDQFPYSYTANCAPIVKLNKVAEHGIMHMVDRVLPPAMNTIMDIIRAREDMTVLRTILEKTDLHKVLEQQGSDKHFTIFAPTDNAFQKLQPDLRRKLKAGSGCATNILKNHILDITFCSLAAVNGVKTTTYNILNEKMVFEFEKSENEAQDMSGNGPLVINGQAKLMETDLMGSNGVLHVIDTVLPTDSGMPVSTTLENHNLTIFKQLIDQGEFQDDFDAYQNVSYFIPSDKAFQNSEMGNHWIQQLKENPESLKGNADLKQFLGYHVVEPLVKTCDFQEKMMPTKSGEDLRVNLYTTHPVFVNVMNRATVNCARLIHFDDESCGSVVHEVDKVLEPPKYTILEQLEANKDYSMFYSFAKKANVTNLLNNTEDNLTVFVPKDDVFREMEDWYNEDELEAVIKAHIVPDVICCAGIVQSDWPFVRTASTINNLRLKLNHHRRPQVQNAGVTKCDIITKNGVIHEINDVISVQPTPRHDTNVNVNNRNVFNNRPFNFWF